MYRACCCAGTHHSSGPELPDKITDDEDKNKSGIELHLPKLLIANKKTHQVTLSATRVGSR